MKIIITVAEAKELDVLDDLFEIGGINPWALNEGLIQDHEEIELKGEEAHKFMGVLLKAIGGIWGGYLEWLKENRQ